MHVKALDEEVALLASLGGAERLAAVGAPVVSSYHSGGGDAEAVAYS